MESPGEEQGRWPWRPIALITCCGAMITMLVACTIWIGTSPYWPPPWTYERVPHDELALTDPEATAALIEVLQGFHDNPRYVDSRLEPLRSAGVLDRVSYYDLMDALVLIDGLHRMELPSTRVPGDALRATLIDDVDRLLHIDVWGNRRGSLQKLQVEFESSAWDD